jgi:hypothetical protein
VHLCVCLFVRACVRACIKEMQSMIKEMQSMTSKMQSKSTYKRTNKGCHQPPHRKKAWCCNTFIIIIITRLPIGVWFMRPIICACVRAWQE